MQKPGCHRPHVDIARHSKPVWHGRNPGMVIGRTVVIGDINNADLARLIAEEAADPGICS